MSQEAAPDWSAQWAPPSDPEKPLCPYQQGFEVEIRTHTAPEPFGHRLYAPGLRQRVADDVLRKTTQTALVVGNPPIEPATAPAPASTLAVQRARLTITDSLAIGNARGAQVVICSIERAPATDDLATPPVTFTAVAKIFDALCYPFANREFPTIPVDPTYDADVDYSREVAAFEHMRKTGGQLGGFAPDYYGSWTFTLPIHHNGEARTRPVRLILLENLSGASMTALYATNTSGPGAVPDAFHISEDWRLEVLARLLEGIMRQRHAGVDQRDLAPRNVHLVAPQPGERLVPGGAVPPRVVLIDYNISIVWEKSLMGLLPYHYPNTLLPPNPMKMYWTETLPQLAGWVPDEWYKKPKLRQQWLVQRFGGQNAARFAPLENEGELDFTE